MSMPAKTRRILMRSALATLYIAIAAITFIYGRGHTLLLDNKSAADGSYEAFRLVDVSVNGKAPLQLAFRDRLREMVSGQKHRITFEVNGTKYDATLRVPFGEDIILVSIPKLAAGIDPFWEPFRSEARPAPAPAEETPPSLEEAPSIGG